MKSHNHIDELKSMYPVDAYLVDKNTDKLHLPTSSTVYGYVLDGEIHAQPNISVRAGEYFSFPVTNSLSYLTPKGTAIVIIRVGFIGQTVIGGPIEDTGRLVYIDGCSDTILVYPPRKGDPSLSHLHFPKHIDQQFHLHPSVRVGLIVKGEGICEYMEDGKVVSKPLKTGKMFHIPERETHRFLTKDSTLDIIAFHPDGDWGPEDENHIMKNRTYL